MQMYKVIKLKNSGSMPKEIDPRFIFIEQIAWWEGRVNTVHLSNKYNLSRQAASAVIKSYRAMCPENLCYNGSIKGYLPTAAFAPIDSLPNFTDYLESVQPKMRSGNNTVLCANAFSFEVEAPLRNINPRQVRPILRAIREQLAIDIGYISLSSPNYLDRIIQPHALIFDGLRWHVRAFCNKNQQYRDFTLSRFNGQASFDGKATQISCHGLTRLSLCLFIMFTAEQVMLQKTYPHFGE